MTYVYLIIEHCLYRRINTILNVKINVDIHMRFLKRHRHIHVPTESHPQPIVEVPEQILYDWIETPWTIEVAPKKTDSAKEKDQAKR